VRSLYIWRLVFVWQTCARSPAGMARRRVEWRWWR